MTIKFKADISILLKALLCLHQLYIFIKQMRFYVFMNEFHRCSQILLSSDRVRLAVSSCLCAKLSCCWWQLHIYHTDMEMVLIFS